LKTNLQRKTGQGGRKTCSLKNVHAVLWYDGMRVQRSRKKEKRGGEQGNPPDTKGRGKEAEGPLTVTSTLPLSDKRPIKKRGGGGAQGVHNKDGVGRGKKGGVRDIEL